MGELRSGFQVVLGVSSGPVVGLLRAFESTLFEPEDVIRAAQQRQTVARAGYEKARVVRVTTGADGKSSETGFEVESVWAG